MILFIWRHMKPNIRKLKIILFHSEFSRLVESITYIFNMTSERDQIAPHEVVITALSDGESARVDTVSLESVNDEMVVDDDVTVPI